MIVLLVGFLLLLSCFHVLFSLFLFCGSFCVTFHFSFESLVLDNGDFSPKCIGRALPFSGTAFEFFSVFIDRRRSRLFINMSSTIRADTFKKLFQIFKT